jgi:hypothetical protein
MAAEPQKVDVKVTGTVLVGLQRGNEIWSFDMLIRRLTAFIADEVLPRLEPFLG